MNQVKSMLTIVALATIIVVTQSCKDKTSDNSTTQTEELGKEYTSTYVCPMHCEGSGSNKEGNCPVCGMNYIKNNDYNTHKQKHDN